MQAFHGVKLEQKHILITISLQEVITIRLILRIQIVFGHGMGPSLNATLDCVRSFTCTR